MNKREKKIIIQRPFKASAFKEVLLSNPPPGGHNSNYGVMSSFTGVSHFNFLLSLHLGKEWMDQKWREEILFPCGAANDGGILFFFFYIVIPRFFQEKIQTRWEKEIFIRFYGERCWIIFSFGFLAIRGTMGEQDR